MDWKNFLQKVSDTVIQSGDLLDRFSDADGNWLGFNGLSDKEIKNEEIHLGTNLPPSYKAFIETINGFKQLSCFVWDILPIEKIDWLKNVDPGLVEVYTVMFKDEFETTDEEYFVYGEEQQPTTFRSSYFESCLAVSGYGDATILLLNPEIKFGEEWEAWMYAPWNLGLNRYQSFEQLMIGEFEGYLEVLKDKSETPEA